jgi:hypothetical protein
MYERDVNENEVKKVILTGEKIETYSDDKPYPSYLCLLIIDDRPLHVVYAKNKNELIVITVYEPNLNKWNVNFRTRK